MRIKTRETKSRLSALIKSKLSPFTIVILTILMSNFSYATTYKTGESNFELINPQDTRNIIGNTLIIGNTIECITKYYYLDRRNYNLPNSLDQLQSADCENDLDKNDNNYFVKYIDIDNNSTTLNSSSATIQFPNTYKEIAWAGLFWQGHINNYSYQYYNTEWSMSNDFPSNIENINANKIKLKIGNENYQELEAERVDYFGSGDGVQYSAFVNITDKINSTIVSDTNITVADITTTKGLETSLGNYGAWTLVIVYKENENNIDSKLRNNSVYYGYKAISDGNPDTITVTDFLLPKSGTIDSQMAVFAAEGEYAYQPDSIKLDNIDLGAVDCTTSADDPSCKTNIFDAKLSPNIIRNPSLTNNNGIDIDIFDTSTIMTTKRDANPDAISYSSTISLSSDWDMYFPSMVSFTTELYKPRVCYYVDKIIDENNQTVYENKNFIQDLIQNKNYKISMWIANMKKDPNDIDIEIAKKVKVVVDYRNFNYTSESTFIKNTGWNSFTHITDILNDDIGEFISDLNQSNWRVGDGATSTSGGTIYPATDFNDDANKVFVDINGIFIIDNNTTEINLDNIFSIKASYATDILDIINPLPIPKCQDFNTTGNTYIPTLGAFNVINKNYTGGTVPSDVNHSTNALYTQVVNNPFEVKVVSLDNDLETPKNIDAMVLVELIKNPSIESECLTNPALTENNVTFINESFTLTLSYSKADKDLRFRVKYLVDQYGSIIDWNGIGACSNNTGTIYNDYACIWGLLTSRVYDNAICNEGNGYAESQCPCATVCNPATNDSPNHNEECVQCVFGDPNLSQSTCSRDNFAIRPNEFNFTISGTSPYKAGKDYNISFEALDENNTTVIDYNETISSSFKININEIKPGCKTGTFNPDINSSWNFIDGNKTIQSNYSEVGTLNIKIKEINGSEFAKVDVDDTNDNDRLITPYDKNISFLPSHFKINAILSNGGNNYTYISNDLNMSATLDINITAEAENNATTTNYNSACYAQTTDYNISYTSLSISPLNSLSQVIYSETNTSTDGNISINTDISLLTIPNTVFSTDNNGTGTIHVDINFDRNETKVVNPFTLNIKDINVTDTNNTAGNITLDKNTTFYYGRVHAPDQRFEGNSGTAKIYYEVYCDGCDKSDFNITGSESIDSINWFTNTLHASNDGNVTYMPLNANTSLSITNSANVANGKDNTTITVPANSLPYKDKIKFNPSSTWLVYNPTDFLIEFYGTGKWAGQGIQGKTVDLNISRKQNKRLDW